MNEDVRKLSDRERAMLELSQLGLFPLFPAFFVNWSENATRQAQLVIEYEVD